MYARELGRPAAAYDDQLYAFLADAIGGQASQTVVWPTEVFAQCNNQVSTQALTVDAIERFVVAPDL
jgi:hypothetical protein